MASQNNMNGRPINFELHSNVFGGKQYTNFTQKAITGIQERTPVSDLFFDIVNIKALQHGIRYSVYKKTCGKNVINDQNEDQLLIVMRSIYLQYCKNLRIEIVEQVKLLNARVLAYCVNQIVSELEMYNKYLVDRETIPVSFNPISTSKAGTRNY